jgi:L-fuconolactonase
MTSPIARPSRSASVTDEGDALDAAAECVVDTHTHVWSMPSADRPWDPRYGSSDPAALAHRRAMERQAVTCERAVSAMRALRVNAALIVSSAVYGYDNAYAFDAARRYPQTFRVIGRVDPGRADLSDALGTLRRQQPLVGLRVLIADSHERERLAAGAYDRLFGLAQAHAIPVCLYAPQQVTEIRRVATSFPDLQLVLDHGGLAAPTDAYSIEEAWEGIHGVEALAQFNNVAVKLSALHALSARPFPFGDIWPWIHSLLEAFGLERAMWGSDWTRTPTRRGYFEAMAYLRDSAELSAADRRQVMGETARRIFNWPEPVAAA